MAGVPLFKQFSAVLLLLFSVACRHASTPVLTNFSPSADAIVLQPGDDVTAIATAAPAGSEFFFSTGRYTGVSIFPKTGDIFRGEAGAVLDGEGIIEYAFAADDPNAPISAVIIQGFTIEGYATPPEQGTVGGGGAYDWRVVDNDISGSGGAAVGLNDGMQVIGNFIHHNSQIGLVNGTSSTDIAVVGNEIAYNNQDDFFDMAFEAGGTKFVQVDGLLVKDNYVHDNHGAGLWTDGDNRNVIFANNLVVDNHGPGIHHEISGSALITGNTIRGNSHEYYFGGILIAASSNVEISNNFLEGNDGGIVLLQEEREGHLVENVSVVGNDIAFETGLTGVIDAIGDGTVFTRGIEFRSNTYGVPSGNVFAWLNGEVDLAGWTAFGLDS